MFKFIAQVFVSTAVGLAAAAGANAGVRGHIEKAWQESNAYIQDSVDFVADATSNITTHADANANVSANIDTNVLTDDASVESTSAVQADGSLNLDQALPEILDVQTDGAVDAQTQTNTSAESEDAGLSLLQQLGLSLGFGSGE